MFIFLFQISKHVRFSRCWSGETCFPSSNKLSKISHHQAVTEQMKLNHLYDINIIDDRIIKNADEFDKSIMSIM